MIAAFALKWTLQGLLIYATMGLYLAAFLASLARRPLAAWAAYVAGFGAAVASVVYRGWQTGHWPLTNLFEVLLFVGALMLPLSLFCRAALRVGAEAGDMILGAAILFAPAFVLAGEPKRLVPALQTPLFVPHVATYMVAYAVLLKAAVQAAIQLATRNRRLWPYLVDPERAAYRVACLGFPLLTAGLILGCWWIQICSGDWWNWDPKEMWSLATWVTYVLYFHVRAIFYRRFRRLNAVLCLAGAVLILLTLFWASLSNLFQGYHGYGAD